MADPLKDMFNQKPGMLSMATDPWSLKDYANDRAISEYGLGESAGGKADALRHILASAIMSKRHGDTYSTLIGNLHESPIPGIGAPAQAVEDRDMDMYNNELGRKLASSAKDYEDLVSKAKQAIDNGTAKLVYERAPTAQPNDYDKNVTFQEWLGKYMSK
jgi:hypothetical protein